MNSDFEKKDIKEQVSFINSKTITGMKVIDVAKEIGMGDKTLRTRLKENNYIFNRPEKIYVLSRDKNDMVITKESDNIIPKEVIKNDNKSIKANENPLKSSVVKNEPIPPDLLQELKINLGEIKELLEMKEQIKEIIQKYNKSINTIAEEVQQDLKIDKDKLNGELKSRLIKVYNNVNVEWIKFCKNNNQFKMQDLCSIALLEFIEKYSKKYTTPEVIAKTKPKTRLKKDTVITKGDSNEKKI
ncbi:hypothetical protein [Clostridium estertheticum]|uniref:hypothetical protein n=1 Tax=Clostridium estertheticum TaxID=238834 RepID=UPI001C7E0D97|nr:hypothetical protein [Clostridium estertheticum]MBX4272207.1 hypothetical protein [Clostridium estertheticum]WLC82426.1 hypothetical protein KTC98_24175 [Clostridium estertheticum]